MINSGIPSKSVAKEVLHYMHLKKIGHFSKGKIAFFPSDRLKTALMALHIGCDIERISSALTWRDFEALTVEILERLGYATQTNAHLRKPRCEIDVTGIDSKLAIVIECKHWKSRNVLFASCYAKKQLKRTELLLQKRTKNITSAIPLIVTLHYERVNLVNKVPIIPITILDAFMNQFDLILQVIQVMRD
jgi:hypothetical protein